ncbi:MAG: M48 family metallopeptidase, partial [Geobacter sp.]|nr:M48 family metallopeptidase [Geobacter sp.]
APAGTEGTEIDRKVCKRARWILRQQSYFRQFEPRTPARQFVGGETHLYLGRQYRLKVSIGGQDAVKLRRGYFLLEVKDPTDSGRVRQLVERWYADKAAIRFRESFDRCWSNFTRFGAESPRLQVRRMKKRWGSLSRSGLLTLNTDLVRAPQECIDYVITHELCHTLHHDHGSAFYELLREAMPDWERRKHKLELALA